MLVEFGLGHINEWRVFLGEILCLVFACFSFLLLGGGCVVGLVVLVRGGV